MNNMGFKIVGTLHVILLGEKSPTEADWEEYLQAILTEERKGVDATAWCTCVFSDGGGPGPGQRKAIADLLHGRPSKVAVVTTSNALRGIMTAMSWFNPQAKAFSPQDVGAALSHLGLSHSKFDSIKVMAQDLLKSLGLKQVKALDQASLSTGASARL
jgi:hypothetical protein